MVRMALPMGEVRAEVQTQVEELTGQARLRIRTPFWKTK